MDADSGHPKLAGPEQSCADCVLFKLYFARDIRAAERRRLDQEIMPPRLVSLRHRLFDFLTKEFFNAA